MDPAPGTEPGLQVYRRSLRLPDTWVQRVRDWYPEHNWSKEDGSGVAFSPSTGFHLPDGSLLSPDCS